MDNADMHCRKAVPVSAWDRRQQMGVGRQESTVGKLDKTHQQPYSFPMPVQCVCGSQRWQWWSGFKKGLDWGWTGSESRWTIPRLRTYCKRWEQRLPRSEQEFALRRNLIGGGKGYERSWQVCGGIPGGMGSQSGSMLRNQGQEKNVFIWVGQENCH